MDHYSQIISRSNIFHHHFDLPEVNIHFIQVQNGPGVLGRLFSCIKDTQIACWVLHGHLGPVYIFTSGK